MTKEDLIDKYVHWALIHYDMNKKLPLRDVLNEVQFQIANLLVTMNHGNVAKTARDMGENRTTLYERLRLKGWAKGDELRKMCAKHSVDYYERKFNDMWLRNETPEVE